MSVYDIIKRVDCKEDFLLFINELRNDIKENPGEWENDDLNSYLSAVGAWTNDMEGYFINQGIDKPSSIPWNLFANILLAAKMYE